MAGYPTVADNPEKSAIIVAMRAAGATQDKIAQAVGCDASVVSRALALPSLKERLELAHKALVNSCLDAAVDNVTHLVTSYRTLEPGQEKDHAYKATQKMLETVGLAPTHTQAPLTVNVFNAQQVTLTPVVQQVVQRVVGGLLEAPDEDEIIDV